MEHLLDVSMLEPCEPLERSLDAIRSLHAGDYLRLIHRRDPQMLYPLLEKSGFSWYCKAVDESDYQIFIWRAEDTHAEQDARRQFES